MLRSFPEEALPPPVGSHIVAQCDSISVHPSQVGTRQRVILRQHTLQLGKSRAMARLQLSGNTGIAVD